MTAPVHAALVLASLVVAGCQDDGGGATCRIDSDCGAGLLCALDGRCRTPDEVADAFSQHVDVEVISVPDGDDGDTTEVESAQPCTPLSGAFEAATPPCPSAPLVLTVTNMQLATEGHGMAQLAGVANQVLTNSFTSGDAKLELRVDGSLSEGCARVLMWVRDARDINADCTPVHSTTMPFEVQNLVVVTVEAAVYDPNDDTVRGRVDKETLIESLDPELRSVAEGLIHEDIDLDGDSLPDRASVIIQLTF